MPGAGQLVGETHVLQLANRTGGEAIAAGLLARVALAFHHDHVVASAGEPIGARRPRRPATDHQYVATAGTDRGDVVHPQQSTPWWGVARTTAWCRRCRRGPAG